MREVQPGRRVARTPSIDKTCNNVVASSCHIVRFRERFRGTFGRARAHTCCVCPSIRAHRRRRIDDVDRCACVVRTSLSTRLKTVTRGRRRGSEIQTTCDAFYCSFFTWYTLQKTKLISQRRAVARSVFRGTFQLAENIIRLLSSPLRHPDKDCAA